MSLSLLSKSAQIVLILLLVSFAMGKQRLNVKQTVNCITKVNDNNCLVSLGYVRKCLPKDKKVVKIDLNLFYPSSTLNNKRPSRYIKCGNQKNVFKVIVKCGILSSKNVKGYYWKMRHKASRFYIKTSLFSLIRKWKLKPSKNNGCVRKTACKSLKCHYKKGSYYNRCLINQKNIFKRYASNVCKKKCFWQVIKPNVIKKNIALKNCLLKFKTHKYCIQKLKLKRSQCVTSVRPGCQKDCVNRMIISKYKTFKLKCKTRSKLICSFHSKLNVQVFSGSKRNPWSIIPIDLTHKTTLANFLSMGKLGKRSINTGFESYFKKSLRNKMWIVPVISHMSNKKYTVVTFDVPKSGSGGFVDIVFSFGKKSSKSNPLVKTIQSKNTKIIWNKEKRTLRYISRWTQYTSSTVVLKSSVKDCISFKILKCVGVSSRTYAIGGIKKKGKWKRYVKHFQLGFNKLCSKCGHHTSVHYTGVKPCRKYDKCGVCNGNGKSCLNKSNCDGCDLNIKYKNTCDVRKTPDNKFIVVRISGHYKKGVTKITTTHFDRCGIKTPWKFVKDIKKKSGHILRIMENRIPLNIVKNCVKRTKGHLSVSFHADYVNPVKFSSKRLYSVPCKFNINFKGKKSSIIGYFHRKPHLCYAKIKNIRWVSTASPKYPHIYFTTHTARAFSSHSYLSTPKIISYESKSRTRHFSKYFRISKVGNVLCTNKDTGRKCIQLWMVRYVRPISQNDCMIGKMKVKFLHVNGKKKTSTPLTLNFYNLCPPPAEKPLNINLSCKMELKGPLEYPSANKKLQYIPIGVRSYYRIKSKKRINLQHIRICFRKHGTVLKKRVRSCNEPGVTIITLYDYLRFRSGGIMRTIVSNNIKTLTGFEVRFSFISYLFNKGRFADDHIMEIFSYCLDKRAHKLKKKNAFSPPEIWKSIWKAVVTTSNITESIMDKVSSLATSSKHSAFGSIIKSHDYYDLVDSEWDRKTDNCFEGGRCHRSVSKLGCPSDSELSYGPYNGLRCIPRSRITTILSIFWLSLLIFAIISFTVITSVLIFNIFMEKSKPVKKMQPQIIREDISHRQPRRQVDQSYYVNYL